MPGRSRPYRADCPAGARIQAFPDKAHDAPVRLQADSPTRTKEEHSGMRRACLRMQEAPRKTEPHSESRMEEEAAAPDGLAGDACARRYPRREAR